MLDDLGLIHMNARIYDPELGKFLQADSQVEDDATQGLNRYSYCLNNPLSLTDPTGHRSKAVGYLKAVVAIVISIWLPGSAAIFGSYAGGFGAYVVAGFVSGTITGGLQGGLEGAFTAGLFYGIGSHFAGLKKIKEGSSALVRAGRAGAKILAHAAAGGTISVLQGGKFGHGFVSAGITEAVSPTITDLHSDFAKVATSAMVGGSTSVIAGGKFGNGAATGAFQMAVTLAMQRPEGVLNDDNGDSELGKPMSAGADGLSASNFEDSYDLSGLRSREGAYQSQFKHFNESGTYDVIGHGNGNTRMWFDGRTIGAPRLAELISADGNFTDRPRGVNLHVCNAGRGQNPLARRLANLLGVPVSGPTRLGLISKQGNYRPQPPGVQKWFLPDSWIGGY